MNTINKNNRYLLILLALFLMPSLSLSDSASDKNKKASSPLKVIVAPIIKTTPLLPRQIKVPSLKCKSFSSATQLLKQQGFKIAKKGYILSRACGGKSNRIVSQKPLSGTSVKSGSTVSVTLSSLPLRASLSSSSNKVTEGRSLTFSTKVNYKNATLIWKLDKKTVAEKSTKFIVNTRNLSVGTHLVTVEVELKHLGLRPQKKVMSKEFVVTATNKLPAPTIVPSIILNRPDPTKKTASNKKETLESQPNAVPKLTPPASTQEEPTTVVEPSVAAPVATTRPELPSTNSTESEVLHYSIEIEPSNAAEKPNNFNIETTEPAKDEKGADLVDKKVVDKKAKEDKHYGKILYNPPTEMTKNKAERVEVRIGWDSVDDKGLIGTGKIQQEEIPVSTYMTVKLCCGAAEKDHPFDISSLNTEATQIIDPTGFTQWAFDVTPRKSGEHNLNLSVSAHYTFANNKTRSKDIPVITRIIKVKVDAAAETKSWFIANWKWLASSIFIPLLLWYLSYRLNQQKKKKRDVNKNIKIFISYRRDDSSGYSLALYKQLNPVFGDENVFMDTDDIPHGSDFVKQIETVLSQAQIALVMIGKQWINASNAKGRRLDDPTDFVRLEVATALQRNIRVIPVLLKGAKMPTEAELPDALKALSRRNAIQIHDDQFEGSIKQLIKTITAS